METGKDEGNLSKRRVELRWENARRGGGRTRFGHQNSIKDHLRDIEDEGEEYENFHSPEQPDVDALNILPASEGRETCECHQTDESVDLYARALWPVLVDDSINDENETIEEIDKRREGQTE